MSVQHCQVCLSLLSGRWVERHSSDHMCGEYYHHDSAVSLRQCATLGLCNICKAISWSLSNRDTYGPVTFTMNSNFVSFWVDDERGLSSNFHDFYLCPEKDFQALPLGQAEGHTLSRTRKDFIRTRIESCNRNHKACISSKTAHEFPSSRLVDIGTASQNYVRIVETKKISAQLYATLSHCWGKTNVFRLVKESEAMLYKGVKTSDLPLTFSHAVEICRFIGLRYLWIDSLCILQDSREDWRAESSRMSEIYRQSYINIAASESMDSDGGLFLDQDPAGPTEAIYQPIQVVLEPITENLSRIGFSLGKHLLLCPAMWTRINDMPLNRRAWVLQERLLSPRILHFTKGRVFWECEGEVSCEGFANLQHEAFRVRSTLKYRNEVDMRMVVKGGTKYQSADWPLKFLAAWGVLIEHYSNCGLTKEEDKLVAIHGIIKKVEENMNNYCHAGHWETNFLASLCWKVSWGHPQVRKIPFQHLRPHEWRAPSWSWASLNLPLSYRFPLDGLEVSRVVEISATRLNNGELLSGKLRILGALFIADFYEEPECEDFLEYHYRDHYHVRIGATTVCQDGIYGDNGHFNISSCFIFPLVATETVEEGFSTRVYCLMLFHAGSGKGVFQRTGLVELLLKRSYSSTFAGIEQPTCCAVRSESWDQNEIEII